MWLKILVWWRSESTLQIYSAYIAGCNAQNRRNCINGIIDPQINILHLQVAWIYLFCQIHKIFLKNVTKQLMVTSWYYGGQWGPLIFTISLVTLFGTNCIGQLLVSHVLQCERAAPLCTYTSCLLRVFMCGFGNLQRCRDADKSCVSHIEYGLTSVGCL